MEEKLWNTPQPGEWKSEELSQGRIIDYKAFNFVDGEGVRNSLYVAGCMFHCQGCYNVATWNFRAGIPYTQELEEQIMADLKARGITPVYLFTDYTGFYERYGWEFFCMAQGDGEEKPSRKSSRSRRLAKAAAFRRFSSAIRASSSGLALPR